MSFGDALHHFKAMMPKDETAHCLPAMSPMSHSSPISASLSSSSLHRPCPYSAPATCAAHNCCIDFVAVAAVRFSASSLLHHRRRYRHLGKVIGPRRQNATTAKLLMESPSGRVVLVSVIDRRRATRIVRVQLMR